MEAKISKIVAHLGEEKRAEIIILLSKSAMTVQNIVDKTGSTQPNISQHLAKMYADGVVKKKRKGKYVLYSLQKRKILSALEKIVEEIE